MIAARFRPVTALRLYDARDEPWIAQLLDIVEAARGEPWRVLLERIDAAPLAAGPPQIAAMVSALRRVLGGRTARARIARSVRARILGRPVLDRDARDARIAIAAAELGVAPADVESLLWADLARERPVVLPNGRPAPRSIAAFANVDRIQRAVRRAHQVELRVSGDAHDLVRAAARRGLICSVSRAADAVTVLDMTGPLALFHDTTIYGRALAALVPLLVDHASFTLDIRSRIGERERMVRIEPPVWLPPLPVVRSRRPGLAERLARDLANAGCTVEREPSPIASGELLLFPELAFEHAGRRRLLEVVGFSTEEYLAHKLARYRAAGAPSVVLCVDAARGDRSEPPRHPGHVVRYDRRIDAAAVLAASTVPS